MIINSFTMRTRWHRGKGDILYAQDGDYLFHLHPLFEGYKVYIFSVERGNLLDTFEFPSWRVATRFCAAHVEMVQDFEWYRHPDFAEPAVQSVWTFNRKASMWHTGNVIHLSISLRDEFYYPAVSGAGLKTEWKGPSVLTWEEAARACVTQMHQTLGFSPTASIPREWYRQP